MKIQDHLKSIYASTGDTKWIDSNRFVFEQARVHGMALAGSIAIALSHKKSDKNPSDIDLVCSSAAEAMAFIQSLEFKLMGYKSHWRVFVNHETEYCPPGCITHFRFQSAMWLPICIMVIPHDKFRFWLSLGGIRVQLWDFVKESAAALGEIDGKERNLTDPLREVEPTTVKKDGDYVSNSDGSLSIDNIDPSDPKADHGEMVAWWEVGLEDDFASHQERFSAPPKLPYSSQE